MMCEDEVIKIAKKIKMPAYLYDTDAARLFLSLFAKEAESSRPEVQASDDWNAALEEAALYLQEQDCAHKCGIGIEIAEKIRSRKVPSLPPQLLHKEKP